MRKVDLDCNLASKEFTIVLLLSALGFALLLGWKSSSSSSFSESERRVMTCFLELFIMLLNML